MHKITVLYNTLYLFRIKIKCFIITFKLTATELDTRDIIGNVNISAPVEDAPKWGEMRLKFKQKNRTLGKPK